MAESAKALGLCMMGGETVLSVEAADSANLTWDSLTG